MCIRDSLYPGNELELIVRDWGIGIADVEQARAPLFTTGNEAVSYTHLKE